MEWWLHVATSIKELRSQEALRKMLRTITNNNKLIILAKWWWWLAGGSIKQMS
jgi:hypothetical protein